MTFVQNGSPDGVLVGLTGGVSTTGTLAAGTYSASGSDSDLTGDTGTWTYSLVVPVITQTSPTSTTTTVSGSTTFTDQLAVTGNVGAVTFATSSATAGLSVSPGGAVSTVGGPLGAGVYTATGTDTDTNGDSGTWIYTLSVTGPLTQSLSLIHI